MNDYKRIMNSLKHRTYTIDELPDIDASGLYALFLTRPLPCPSQKPIPKGSQYIGKADNLTKRLKQQHFASGGTPQSSPRRTFGGLLRSEIKLKPEGLGRGKFRFLGGGEKALTHWMKKNIRVGIHKASLNQLSKVEKALISHAKPALNLMYCENAWKKEIKRLRKECAKN